jgi:hypothetical protein
LSTVAPVAVLRKHRLLELFRLSVKHFHVSGPRDATVHGVRFSAGLSPSALYNLSLQPFPLINGTVNNELDES